MEKFNENLEQLIKNLSKINGDINYSKYYDFTDPGDKYVNMFYKNCSKFSNDIANKDEIIFSEENTILDNINFNQISHFSYRVCLKGIQRNQSSLL